MSKRTSFTRGRRCLARGGAAADRQRAEARRRWRAAGRAPTSTSAAVLQRPRVKQSEPSASAGVQPMARSTCEGVWVREAQAEPDEAAIPARSRSSSTLSAFTPRNDQARVMREATVERPGHPALGDRLQHALQQPVAQRRRAARARRARASAPDELRGHPEPDQRRAGSPCPSGSPTSCPPPRICGASFTPGRTHSAPVPGGP